MAANWHTLQSTPQFLLQADEPEVEESENKAQDKEKKKEKKLKVWSKSTYSHPEQARPGDFFYTSAKSRMAINCTKRTHRLLQKIYYAADGQEIKFVHHGEDERIEAIVPDSAEEQISDFACTFKTAKTDVKTPRRTLPKSVMSAEKPVTTEKAALAGKSPQKPRAKAAPKKKTPGSDKSKTPNSKDCVCAEPKPKR